MVTVKIENLSYSYKDSATSVLHDISLSFSSGERVAIIGQNGTGKTTLTKHLNGILTPDTGRVLIDNVNVENKTTAEWASKVGYVFQNPNDQLFLDTVKKELVFGPSHLGIPKKEIQKRIRFVSELVGMQEELAEHPLNLTDSEKKILCNRGSFSYGSKRCDYGRADRWSGQVREIPVGKDS
ncbi:energy-coupling factor ABC transporter ATP-binding protein [Secundilactobacillus kimchicus]|uniref:energy-coupling factor ABC transporter ATP-binding protein n=1 Tax=Secundilactobacillus kimchicus TaxID=528209 RepID=UPI000AF4F042|nr:ABC transporter ATP-binding protein [Secundilactobacillus kimchicus]